MENVRMRRVVITALFAAFLCILAPVCIPVGAIPVSLGTFCVCLLALLADRRCALMALLLYVGMGAIGLPVFAGYVGGGQVLVGPTGGFLMGYIFMVMVISLFCRRRRSVPRMVAGTLLGHLVCYAVGTAWYAVLAKVPPVAAFAVGVLPFLAFDAVKIAAVIVLVVLLGDRIDRAICCNEKNREK